MERYSELWEKTFTNSPIAIAVIAPNGKLLLVNKSLCELLDYQEDQLLRYRWQDLTHPEDLLQESALVFDLATGDRDQFKINKRYVKRDGSDCMVVVFVSAIRSASQDLEYLLSQAMDITELSRLRQASKIKLTPDLRTDILIALREGELSLEYEPIVSLKNDTTVGYEGLIRWNHPQKGLIPPLEWIPACEEDSALMAQICSFVLSASVKDFRDREGWVSLNISPLSLRSPQFLSLLAELSWVSDSPRIYLEITERMPLDAGCLARLQSLGYGVLLDDFGQGHSSLIQLLEILNQIDNKHFKIKIDGWFSNGLADRTTQLVMCEFVAILHGLDLDVIAECVENEAQLRLWKELGADYGQGWFWKT